MLNGGRVVNGSAAAPLPSKSSSLGGLLKRLSPSYHRSRSKSPVSHLIGRNGDDSDKKTSSSSWVTVELKANSSARDFHSNGHDPDGVAAPKSGKSRTLPLSPMSTSMIECGSADPADFLPCGLQSFSPDVDSSSKSKSSLGNFLRHSLRRCPKKTSTLPRNKADGSDICVDQSSPGFGACPATSEKTSAYGAPLTPTSPTKSSLSSRRKFDDFLTALANAASPRRKRRGHGGAAVDLLTLTSNSARAAVSEENLVSKVLHAENSTFIGLSHEEMSPESCEKSRGHFSGAILSTQAPFYYSQNNMFDDSTTPSRVPSYVRLSCTLSGYKNYRAVNLKTAASSPFRGTKLSLPANGHFFVEVDGASAKDEGGTSGAECSGLSVDDELLGAERKVTTTTTADLMVEPQLIRLPLGKSIVERRLEKFDSPPTGGSAYKKPLSSQCQTPSTKAVCIQRMDPPLASSADFCNPHDNPPVPVKDLIGSFNKITPPAVPPKQKFAYSSKATEDSVEAQLEKLTRRLHGLNSRQSLQATHNCKDAENEMDSTDRCALSNLGHGPLEKPCVYGFNGKVQEKIDDEEAKYFPLTTGKKLAQGHDFFQAAANGLLTKAVSNGVPRNDRVNLKMEHFDHKSLNSNNGVMDGKFYLARAQKERQRLEDLAKSAEQDLSSELVPEHAAEELRTGVGKVNLLLGKKFVMFENLIDKNLNPIPNDPCPTYNSDLDGYWQLVKLELADVDANFDRINQMRQMEWAEIEIPQPVLNGGVRQCAKSNPTFKKSDTPSSNLTLKLREESRKKLNEAKLAGLERKKKQIETGSDGFFAI